MILTYILLIIGFFLLIKGADLLIVGGASIARRLGVSSLVVGLTIVSFGTSAPEFLISVISAFKGNTDIAISNILGSNIANVFLVLGSTALIYPIALKRTIVWREIPFAFLASVILVILASDILFDNAGISEISRVDGIIFLSFLMVFLYYSFTWMGNKDELIDDVGISDDKLYYSILRSVGGTVALLFGGKFVVDSAEIIAASWGVSDIVIGLTVVAIGTSLPELVTSIVAIYKKHIDIAIGNVVGSTIFNIFFILGVSSIITPIPFSNELLIDALVGVFAVFLLFSFTFVSREHKLKRWQGLSFILIYILYIISLFIR